MPRKPVPRRQSLAEFLTKKNLPSDLTLPWVHSASAASLFSILEDEKLLAINCDVFKGEKLVYFFVGRPAYKIPRVENPSEWQMPVVFVVRFNKPPPIKRVFPFDSGAFHKGRMPSYISLFPIGAFELATDMAMAGRLVSFYFKTQKRYFDRQATGDQEMREEHDLDITHDQILALGKLYRDRDAAKLDDRAAAIEIQIAEDIPLEKSNVLGVVVPAEYKRHKDMREALKALTPNVEAYDIMPLGTDAHYGLVYDCVKKIYKKAGIKL
jgi:hypothetical protein